MTTAQKPEFDYIVIGSGAGGGPVAAHLAEEGYKVALIEAGQAPEPPCYSVPVFHAFATEDPDMSWEFFVKHYEDEVRARSDKKYVEEEGGVFYPRAGTLGGCTAHHAMITVYGHNSDWQYIADLTGDRSWEPEKMREYFERVECCGYVDDPGEGRPNPSRHGYKGWLNTTGPDLKLAIGDHALLETVLDAVKTAWLEGLSGIVPDFIPLDPNDWRDPSFEGIAFAPLATMKGRRAGTRELIRKVERRLPHKLIIKMGHLATKILFDENKRAIGVECWEGDHLYRADPKAKDENRYNVVQYYCSREVILAGGTFNSPQLLMLSGIGDEAHLREHGIEPLVHRPGVGTNLQDRYEVALVSRMKEPWAILEKATFKPPLEGEEGDPCWEQWERGEGLYTSNGAVLAVIKKSSEDRPDPDLFMFALAGKFTGYYPGYSNEIERTKDFLTWVALKAHTEYRAGYVRLKSNDPRERPEIGFKYFDESNDVEGRDLEALLEAVKFMRRMSDNNDAIGEEVDPGKPVDTDDEIRQWIKDNAWGHHASCTNPMGRRDDLNAVVDSNFKVIGVENLRIVDASVFPRIPGLFIIMPIFMIAEKATEVILADARNNPAANVA